MGEVLARDGRRLTQQAPWGRRRRRIVLATASATTAAAVVAGVSQSPTPRQSPTLGQPPTPSHTLTPSSPLISKPSLTRSTDVSAWVATLPVGPSDPPRPTVPSVVYPGHRVAEDSTFDWLGESSAGTLVLWITGQTTSPQYDPSTRIGTVSPAGDFTLIATGIDPQGAVNADGSQIAYGISVHGKHSGDLETTYDVRDALSGRLLASTGPRPNAQLRGWSTAGPLFTDDTGAYWWPPGREPVRIGPGDVQGDPSSSRVILGSGDCATVVDLEQLKATIDRGCGLDVPTAISPDGRYALLPGLRVVDLDSRTRHDLAPIAKTLALRMDLADARWDVWADPGYALLETSPDGHPFRCRLPDGPCQRAGRS